MQARVCLHHEHFLHAITPRCALLRMTAFLLLSPHAVHLRVFPHPERDLTAGNMAKFGDMTLEELMDDIESAFEEMMTMLKDDYKEEDALREVKRMMAALSKILEDVGKTFHRAGSSLKGKPGKVVTEASIAYLKNAHEMKRPLKEFQAAEDLFRDVIQTCIKHTKKIDKCLKDDDDTTQKTIRRTMRQVLVRMKQQADEARSKKEKADRKK